MGIGARLIEISLSDRMAYARFNTINMITHSTLGYKNNLLHHVFEISIASIDILDFIDRKDLICNL